MNKIIQLLVLFFLITSCNSNPEFISGYVFECPNYRECWVLLDKGEPITLDDEEHNNLQKGINMTYIVGTDSSCKILGKGSVIINAYIDSFEEHDRYVFISQKPLQSICECSAECIDKYKMEKNSYDVCKEAISKSKFLNYWIIDKQLDYIYGPLSKQAYDRQIVQLRGIK